MITNPVIGNPLFAPTVQCKVICVALATARTLVGVAGLPMRVTSFVGVEDGPMPIAFSDATVKV